MRFGYCHWIVSPCKVRWLYQHEAPANGSIVDRPSRPIRILQNRRTAGYEGSISTAKCRNSTGHKLKLHKLYSLRICSILLRRGPPCYYEFTSFLLKPLHLSRHERDRRAVRRLAWH